MYQGGYSNFAAKRAARHGKTRQYKESLENKKKNDNKQIDTKDDKNTSSSTKEKREPTAHPKQMVYPVARGPNEITGDTLLIKCLEYMPPQTTSEYEYTLSYADKKGKSEGGIKYNEKDPLRIDSGKNKGKLATTIAPKSFRMSNLGASDRLNNKSGKEHSIFYVELPIPQDVNDSNTVTWGDDSLNILQLAGLAVAQQALENPGKTFDEAKNFLTGGIVDAMGGIQEDTKSAITAAISGKAIDALGGNVSMNSAIGRAEGMALNSNLELLFDSVNLRTFPFTINFSPRTRQESMMVKHIIRAFKSSMAAKKGTSEQGQGGIFLRAPDVFQLRYLHRGKDHPFLNSFKHCALTGMSVNYTGAGTFASYSDGTPVNIKMSLTFKELNPIYFEDYDSFKANDGNGVGF